MASIIEINKSKEIIEVHDENGEAVLSWTIRTDDKSIEKILHQVGNAMDRFAAVSKDIEQAQTEEENQQAAEVMVRLLKRTICAIIGEQGWHDVLAYIGDGKECNPIENISNLGEVFASLVTWLWNHCTNKQLRKAGVFFESQQKYVPKKKKKSK